MPNQKISELTAIVTVDTSLDVLPIVDTSANTTKKISPTALKTALALDNVNNTSDANKPVSTAQQDALNAKVTGNTAIVAATKTKITYDAKGLVTAGNILDPADMPMAINAANIGTGVVSSTEFGYLDGVTSAIQTQLDAKQATLVSATNIKTINSTSLLGAGDVPVQPTLVSGTNIKTLNSVSLLGSGDIVLAATPSGVAGAIQFSNGSAFASDAANLFWDDTNNRLGVGTNAPTNTFEIASTSTSPFKVATTAGYFRSSYKAGSTTGLFDYIDGTGFSFPTDNVVFGTSSSLGARVGIKGSGSTSATTSLLVQNSAGVASLQVTDDGSVFNYGKGSITTNSVFGKSALQNNSTGVQNATFGWESLFYNSTSGYNSAFGARALYTNTASYNSAFGAYALYSTSSGTNNVAVGFSALELNTTGSNNSALGSNTASGNFSGSVILGSGATATASNQFVVGTSTINAGAVTTATALQTKTWDVIINGVAQKILLA